MSAGTHAPVFESRHNMRLIHSKPDISSSIPVGAFEGDSTLFFVEEVGHLRPIWQECDRYEPESNSRDALNNASKL